MTSIQEKFVSKQTNKNPRIISPRHDRIWGTSAFSALNRVPLSAPGPPSQTSGRECGTWSRQGGLGLPDHPAGHISQSTERAGRTWSSYSEPTCNPQKILLLRKNGLAIGGQAGVPRHQHLPSPCLPWLCCTAWGQTLAIPPRPLGTLSFHFLFKATSPTMVLPQTKCTACDGGAWLTVQSPSPTLPSPPEKEMEPGNPILPAFSTGLNQYFGMIMTQGMAVSLRSHITHWYDARILFFSP